MAASSLSYKNLFFSICFLYIIISIHYIGQTLLDVRNKVEEDIITNQQARTVLQQQQQQQQQQRREEIKKEEPKQASKSEILSEINSDYQKSADFHQRQANERKSYFNGAFRYVAEKTAWPTFYNMLVYEVVCPGKVRIGNVGDGGKWICAPWRLPDDCIVYSLGINNNIYFDQSLQQAVNNRCILRGLDKDKQMSGTISGYERIRGTIAVKTIAEEGAGNGTTSLAQFVKQHNDTKIDILKIDIEGAEMKALSPFLDQYSPCQILIETHADTYPTAELLHKISKHNYWFFSFEINSGGIRYSEYSFIHDSCLERYNVIKLARIMS